MERETLKKEIITKCKANIKLPKTKNRVLYIIYGASGSGKTTLAKTIQSKYNAVYISSDDISLSNHLDCTDNYPLTFEILNDLIDDYLSQGYSVVADSNSDTYLIRKSLYRLAQKHCVISYTFYVKTQLNVIRTRQNERNLITPPQLRALRLYHEDIENVKNYLAELEPPHITERIYTIDGNVDLDDQLNKWERTLTKS